MVGGRRDGQAFERLASEHPGELMRRREFLSRLALAAGLASGAAAALSPRALMAEAAARQRAVPLPSPRNLPIDTHVVLMMENRSFDHYLGWLPGADGRQAGTATPTRSATPSRPTASRPTSRAAPTSTPTTPGRAAAPSSTVGGWTASCVRAPTRSRSAITRRRTCRACRVWRVRSPRTTASSARCSAPPTRTASTCTPPSRTG